MIASRSTADLSPTTKAKADALVRTLARDSDIDLLIISTYRDNESQAALYAQGRTTPGHIVTNAKAGWSYHNWRVAFDAIAIINGKCIWTCRTNLDKLTPQWQIVVNTAIKLGLECGAYWNSITDDDHFQLTSGITLAQFQAGEIAP